MTEPDVTLTDYGLAIECALFAYLLYAQGNRRASLRSWFGLFFASIGFAALTGGTVHGFFSDPGTTGYRILWALTLIAGGVAAMASWAIGARLWLSEKMRRVLTLLAVLEFVAYSAAVLFFTQDFVVVVANYLPPTLFLLIVFYELYRHMRIRELGWGAMGFVLTLIAAAIQQGGIGLHPVYFNHNSLYHLVQGVALLLIFWGARWLVLKQSQSVMAQC